MTKQQELAELRALQKELEGIERLEAKLKAEGEAAKNEKKRLMAKDLPEKPDRKTFDKRSKGSIALILDIVFGVLLLIFFAFSALDMFSNEEYGIVYGKYAKGMVLHLIVYIPGVLAPVIVGAFFPPFFLANLISCLVLWFFGNAWEWYYLPSVKAIGIMMVAELLVALLVWLPVITLSEKRKDKKFKKAFSDYEKARDKQLAENEKKYTPTFQARDAALDRIGLTIRVCKGNVHASTILHNDHKTPQTVKYIINLMETGVADSIKEALQIKRAEERATDMEMGRINAMYEMQRFERELEENRRWQEQRNNWARDLERQNREKDLIEQQKRTADELERIRKDLEGN